MKVSNQLEGPYEVERYALMREGELVDIDRAEVERIAGLETHPGR